MALTTVIILLKFTKSWYRFNSPQVKQSKIVWGLRKWGHVENLKNYSGQPCTSFNKSFYGCVGQSRFNCCGMIRSAIFYNCHFKKLSKFDFLTFFIYFIWFINWHISTLIILLLPATLSIKNFKIHFALTIF